jgi:hypothetical protein
MQRWKEILTHISTLIFIFCFQLWTNLCEQHMQDKDEKKMQVESSSFAYTLL